MHCPFRKRCLGVSAALDRGWLSGLAVVLGFR